MNCIHTTPNYLKSCLKNAISAAINAPESDMPEELFSRNRKLPAEELIHCCSDNFNIHNAIYL